MIFRKLCGSGVNRGFRILHNRMCTYVQVKNAFSYCYPKRKLLEDGLSTIPFDICFVNSYFSEYIFNKISLDTVAYAVYKYLHSIFQRAVLCYI